MVHSNQLSVLCLQRRTTSISEGRKCAQTPKKSVSLLAVSGCGFDTFISFYCPQLKKTGRVRRGFYFRLYFQIASDEPKVGWARGWYAGSQGKAQAQAQHGDGDDCVGKRAT